MFNYVSSAKKIELIDVNTSYVKNMNEMFMDCQNLTELSLGIKFNTSNVVNMENMFFCCKILDTIPFSSFDTKNVKICLISFIDVLKLQI